MSLFFPQVVIRARARTWRKSRDSRRLCETSLFSGAKPRSSRSSRRSSPLYTLHCCCCAPFHPHLNALVFFSPWLLSSHSSRQRLVSLVTYISARRRRRARVTFNLSHSLFFLFLPLFHSIPFSLFTFSLSSPPSSSFFPLFLISF